MTEPILNECINPLCPFSGKPVESSSLTIYNGHTVGFCNPDCRDKFAANPEAFPEAKAQFDERIQDIKA